MLISELSIVLILNLLLWGFILAVPPLVFVMEKLWYFGARPAGLAFLNIIFIKRSHYSEAVLRHELAHVRQQRMLSPVGMALVMIVHYVCLLCKYKSIAGVYRNSWFEKQANAAMYQNAKIPRHFTFGRVGREENS